VRERVVLREHGDQWLLDQHATLDARRERAAGPHERGVQLALLERMQQRSRGPLHQLHPHLRALLAQRAHQAGHQRVKRGRGRRAESQAPFEPTGQPTRTHHQVIELHQQAARIGRHDARRVGGVHAPPLPHEEAHAQVVLQLGDGAAERGLRHVDAARGLAHATGVQHGEELAQAAGVDV
jgi:hypothetical protein